MCEAVQVGETKLTGDDLAVTPSRSLYNIAAAIREVSSTFIVVGPIGINTSVHDGKSAVRRVLLEEDFLHGIIGALLDSCTHGDYRDPGTSEQLLGLALTCKDWFQLAVNALWGTFSKLPALVRLLIPENLHGVYKTPQAQYKYIWSTYCADPIYGRLHPLFLIFRFYVGFIRTLCMSGPDFTTPVFSQLARLHDADILLPALRNIGWTDGKVDISSNAVRSFSFVARAPLLSSLAIGVINTSQDANAKAQILEKLCALIQRAASHCRNLTALTVVGPNDTSLPVASLDSFRTLEHLNIQVDLKVPQSSPLSLPTEANSDSGLPLKTLILSWSSSTRLAAIAHVTNFSHLRSLTVLADDHPPAAFLEQVAELGEFTMPSLTYLRIVAGVHFPLTIKGMDFGTLIEPFLKFSTLEDVSIELPSFSIDFVAADVKHMLNAWRRLISLEITLSIVNIYTLPDLRSIIRQASHLCPNLTVLHLPAIATYAHVGRRFRLKFPVARRKLYVSSELIFPEHHPLDVAYSIVKAFGYNPINPKYIPGTYWTSVDTLVEAIENRDRAAVVRHGLAAWWFPWGRIESEIQNVCLHELEKAADEVEEADESDSDSDDERDSDDESDESDEVDEVDEVNDLDEIEGIVANQLPFNE